MRAQQCKLRRAARKCGELGHIEEGEGPIPIREPTLQPPPPPPPAQSNTNPRPTELSDDNPSNTGGCPSPAWEGIWVPRYSEGPPSVI